MVKRDGAYWQFENCQYAPSFYCFFILGFEMREAIYPKKTAAAIPPAAADVPPINAPTKPCSPTSFIAPLASKLPKPVRGTVAPAPAKSINF